MERNTADKDSSDNQDSNSNIGQIAKFAYIQLQQRRLIDGFCNGGSGFGLQDQHCPTMDWCQLMAILGVTWVLGPGLGVG